MKTVLLAVAAATLVAAGPGTTSAQQAEPSPASPAPAASPTDAPAASPAPTPVKTGRASAGADGFVLESESGDFRLQVRGYVQFDGRFYPGADAPAAATDTFLLRRVRPIVQGTVGRYFDFNLTPDFGGGTTALQDAFVEARPSSKLRVRVGKFKAPVSLERLQPATAIAFVERAFPSSLVPNRDVGVQLHGELASGVVAYAAGVFDGAPDGSSVDSDSNAGKDLAGRLFLSPFKRGSSAFRDLGFGIAGSTGRQAGALPTYRSGGQVPIFSYVSGVVADGTRTRIAPQLSFYSGPFALLAEYVRSEASVRQTDGGAPVKVAQQAWQATAFINLSGDAASYSGVRPRKPYDPAQRHWGGVELVARVNAFAADDFAFAGGFADRAVSARKAFAWGVGLNWHLNRNVKQVVDYERTSFTGGAAAGGDRPAENALFVRTQLAF